MDRVKIKIVEDDDIEVFLGILKEIAIWLKSIGKEMWDITKLEKECFLNNFGKSDCYLTYINDSPVATLILKEADDFMWPGIKPNESLFFNKLGVKRSHAGKGISKILLDFIKEEAISRGKKYIRLDCYADRDYLCDLYSKFGFSLVSKKEMEPSCFAALYEMKIN